MKILCQDCKHMSDYDSTVKYKENGDYEIFEINEIYCTEVHGKHGIRLRCPKYKELRRIE